MKWGNIQIPFWKIITWSGDSKILNKSDYKGAKMYRFFIKSMKTNRY